MIPVRVLATLKPVLASDRIFAAHRGHPLDEMPCPVCDENLGEYPVVLVFVGIRPDDRKEGLPADAQVYTIGGAVPVHAQCAGLSAEEICKMEERELKRQTEQAKQGIPPRPVAADPTVLENEVDVTPDDKHADERPKEDDSRIATEWFDQFRDLEHDPRMDEHSQWCWRHWAPCPVLGANGIGATTDLMQIWIDEICPPGEMTTEERNIALTATGKICCSIGDERMFEVWGKWPPPGMFHAPKPADPSSN